MNDANAHFDKLQAQMNKENLGFNVGRHDGKRPSTAVLAWRPNKPFLTYEQRCLTKGQEQDFNNKRLHAKVMNDRVQTYNQQFVPEHLLPKEGLAWVKKSDKPLKKSRSQENIALTKEVTADIAKATPAIQLKNQILTTKEPKEEKPASPAKKDDTD